METTIILLIAQCVILFINILNIYIVTKKENEKFLKEMEEKINKSLKKE